MDLRHILLLTLSVCLLVLSKGEDDGQSEDKEDKRKRKNKFVHSIIDQAKNEIEKRNGDSDDDLPNLNFHIPQGARDVAFRECNPNDYRYVYDAQDDDFKPDDCHYMECVDKEYVQKKCPDGKQVNAMFKKRYELKGNGASSFPCTQPSRICRRTLEDKGVFPIDVKACGIDLVFNVDISCSITLQDKKKVQKFIWRAVRSLPIRSVLTQVGILSFAKTVYPVAHLDSFPRKKELLKAISEMELKVPTSECGTATWLALKNAREEYFHEDNGMRPDKPKVMIVLTDGETFPPEMKEETLREAELNHKAGILSIVIALPNIRLQSLAGQDEWRAIATGDGDDNIYYMTSFNQLGKYMKTIVENACHVI